MALTCKVLFLSISTFETPPSLESQCALCQYQGVAKLPTYCCTLMERWTQPQDTDPIVVHRSRVGTNVRIRVRAGGNAYVSIAYCLWCGQKCDIAEELVGRRMVEANEPMDIWEPSCCDTRGGAGGQTMRKPGRIMGWATLAVLLVAYESPGFGQHMDNKLSDVADQLRTALAGEPMTVRQPSRHPVTITSSADAMFPSGGWELKPGVTVLSKIVPTLSKLQHTDITVGGYTDNTPIGAQLQSAGITNNLELSCRRAGSVVAYLVSQGVNPNLLSVQCFGATHPVAPNDTPEGQAKNRRVDITLTGDGT